MYFRGQRVPFRALLPRSNEFDVPANVVVLHYYGAGGWGIRWGRTYLLTAPYFSNHGLSSLLGSGVLGLEPDRQAVRVGFAGTPVAETSAIVIGHGHVDHAGDVPAFFDEGLIASKPALIADRSTVNLLAAVSEHFGCIAPIEYGSEAEVQKCPLDRVRITPIHHGHAPHLKLAGLDVAAYGSRVKEPMKAEPSRADDFKLGNTWAYLIDLLDENGSVVFRIHYVDAASGPPHGIAQPEVIAERDVDVHIACVPGFEQSDDYPAELIERHRVRYVLAGHWEDFLQSRAEPLMPLRQVLDVAAIDRFIGVVEQHLPEASGVQPARACTPQRPCGPRGAAWALPIPGETFHFEVPRRARRDEG